MKRLAAVLALTLALATPAFASQPPGPPVGLPPMHHALITNAMGVAAVTILASAPGAGGNNGNDITVCASGCTFTSAPAGSTVPAVLYQINLACTTAMTGNVTVQDGTAGDTIFLSGPFGSGQTTTWYQGGWGLYSTSGLTITLSIAVAGSCTVVVGFN